MYQNLRHLLVADQTSDNASIHYLMMPRAKLVIMCDLLLGYWHPYSMAVVDLQIEQSVANLQVVIELGRVIRDRKVLPVKVGSLSVCLCVV